jgi:flagellar hook-associated protein 3 FlgL
VIDTTGQMIYRLGNLNAENERISYQMSTGKKLDRGSDDSKTYARELDINDKMRTYNGLKVQVDKTHAQNIAADSTMEEVKLSLDSLKSEILKSLNAGMDANDKKAVAVNVEGIKENLLTLSNENSNGEYVFAGSDTTIQAFTKDDATGRVFYNGDALLRTVAVAPNTYRERGITGVDAFMYTSAQAVEGEALTFESGDMIIDENNMQWQVTKAYKNDRFTFDKSDTIIDSAGDTWTLDSANNILTNGTTGATMKVEHIKGDQYRTVSIHDDHVNGGVAPDYLQVSGAVQLREVDINGNLTGDSLNMTESGAGTASDPVMFTTDPLANKYQVLTAKHNYFDDVDTIITALETNTNDTQGDIVGLRSTLDMIDNAYDAANIGHSVLGSRNRIFELASDDINSRITHYNILYQEVAGADLAKVAMESKALEMTYSALYSTITKMSELSLVNYVR